jgi:hypothetical protein
MISITQARSAKKRLMQQLQDVWDIRGIGITWTEDGDAYVIVNVLPGMEAEYRHRLPAMIDGVRVEIGEMQEVHVLDED